MITVPWSDSLLTGVSEIDDQHRELLRKINELIEAFRAGTEADEVTRTLEFLADYSREHFTLEESHMATRNYPDATAHKKSHAIFAAKIEKLRAQLDKSGPDAKIVSKTSAILAKWLTEHIVEIDLPFIEFLRDSSHGVDD